MALHIAGCNAQTLRPHLPAGHEGGDATPYPLTYTKQAENPDLRYGMYYSPENYRHCQKLYGADRDRNNITCDYLLLTRPDLPEYWPNGAPPPIDFPAPPAEPTYRPGMTSEQYFNALCEKESGDFVLKTVKDVDGLYLIRPLYYQGDQIRRELFANESPYDEFSILQADHFYLLTETYRFVEFPEVKKYPEHYISPKFSWEGSWRNFRDRPGEGSYWRYWWDERVERHNRHVNPKYFRQRTPAPQSRYGITWRAIERTGFDRDMGVAGTEALVVDLHSGEVLGYRRVYIRALMGKPTPFHGHTGNIWATHLQCPAWKGSRKSTTERSLGDFIQRVLIPAPPLSNTEKGN